MEQARKSSPLGRINIFSAWTYSWLSPILYKGFRRPLEKTDLFALEDSLSSTFLYSLFSSHWPGSSNHTIKRPLLHTISKCFGRKWMFAGMLKLVGDISAIASPFVMSILLLQIKLWSSDVEEGRQPYYYQYILCVIIFLLQMINTFTVNYYFHITMMVGFKVRSCLTAAIYQKSLNLSGLSRQKFSTGQIVNLMSADVNRLDLAAGFMHYLWSGIFQIIAILVILIIFLGPSALAGFAFFIVLFPLQSKVSKLLTTFRKKINQFSDQRIKILQEIFQGIRVIKFYAWEESFLARVMGIRNEELSKIRNLQLVRAFMNAITIFVPLFASILCFIVYSLAGNALTADIIFPALAYFNLLRLPLILFPMVFGFYVDAKVSLERIEKFLLAEELDYSPRMDISEETYHVKVQNATFIWDVLSAEEKKRLAEPPKKVKKSKAQKLAETDKSVLLENMTPPPASGVFNISFNVPKGKLVAVIGSVGSGKSSLLASLVGEMKRQSGEVLFSGSVGYCPQQAWIQNTTLKRNILFGLDYNEEKYERTIDICSLRKDLQVLPAGDMTEIGEKGINLSGGQKQRIGLARLVYFDPEIVLLDDPLSAVDAHVGQFIFEHCICGVLAGKTRIVALNQLYYLSKFDYVILMHAGQILEQGTFDELMRNGIHVKQLMRDFGGVDESSVDEEIVQEDKKPFEAPIASSDATVKPKNDKLMTVEERSLGSVGWSYYGAYLKAAGGLIYVIPLLLVTVIAQLARVGNDLWLSYWIDERFVLSKEAYMGIYAAFGAFQAIIGYLSAVIGLIGGLHASRKLFEKSLLSVCRAKVQFFDTTPLGRIVNRFSKDFDAIDMYLTDSIRMFLTTFGNTVSTFVLISFIIPIFLAPLCPLLVFYYLVQWFYRASSREIKRLDLISKSPLLSSFSEALTGLSTIRAFNEQGRFAKRNLQLIDDNNEVVFIQVNIQRWLGVRLETIGNLLIFAASIFALNSTPELAGLIISYSLNVTGVLNWMIRQVAEVETYMNSVERVVYYIHNVESEKTVSGNYVKPDDSWPSKGVIEFKEVELRYRSDLEPVLKRISFSVNANEKIGIVGRTGAGKSSIMQALFRLVEPSFGTIIIDSVDIMALDLKDVRKNLAIIPQDPVLFSGSIRSNVDPFNEYSDDEIWRALENSSLKDFVSALDKKLESEVLDSGENLSIGQRQLVCLARALLKRTKILVLDEATASIDLATDSVIQKVIRTSFSHATILTIAHRLNTIIDYDRVIVLEGGVVAEYDSPGVLLQNPEGLFSKLVDETGENNSALLRSIAKSRLPNEAQ